ncbi:MAG: PKD domain-containing protein [Candidatus Thermoplasmatota archaeon]|nr:PKD domain-containing protein [Candidatus Thermoplasmatota archaeon]
MQYQPPSHARTSGRACNPHLVGDSLTVPISGGSLDAYVAKTTSTVAFILQNGRTLSSTVLNNLASSWDSTIYPTMTTYYGKDYQDGRGLAAPDIDNNCQVEIVIYDIDGAFNTGGYFAPSFARTRESVFIDYADITLSWGKSIIAHELQHLLHNAQDPYENLWIDEGNADVAIYLCFGSDSTLVSHLNQWTEAPELSIRWWNQRFADYGAGFIFTMYLADHLGGGPAVRQLVQDSATGGASVQNLALSPPSGQPGMIGRTMSEVFANFSVAAFLDSDQGIYGFSNLDLTPTCSSGSFCRAQPTDINSDWSTPYSSTGHSVEGWGLRAFKFTPGASSPAPLTIRLTADVSQFDGVVVSKSMVDGLLSVTDLDFQSNVATALIPGFGNLTDEVWAITWYGSSVADCDYTSCGPSYPQGTVDIEAARITAPASLTINNTELTDRDGDGDDDTVQVNFDVFSNAFFEDLDVETRIVDSQGVVVDEITSRISAGGGVNSNSNIWFTAPFDEQYTVEFDMYDMIGVLVDSVETQPWDLSNMRPVANGSVSSNATQTWENIQFSGGGFDAWGLSLDNNTLPYLDPPVAYAWDFGDGVTSNLKSPTRSYQDIGFYNATLRIMDQGNTWSETDIIGVNVTDDTVPIPVITVNNLVISDNVSVLTNQVIQFSASRTVDNVPIQNLSFQWEWGDGGFDDGLGLYQAQHQWGAIESEVEVYELKLSVFDGFNTGTKNITVYVNNRVPYQIFAENLTTYTYTSVTMPDVFADDDGEIVSYEWNFPEGVNLDGGITDQQDDFVQTQSNAPYPAPSWREPGIKIITLKVTDDAGSESTGQLFVNVLNQIPVADFTVRTTENGETMAIDFRAEDAFVDVPYTFDGLSSFDIDSSTGDSANLEYNWTFGDNEYRENAISSFTFTEPGIHLVSLFVTDEYGAQSLTKTITVRVQNPLPIISVRILDGWIDGEQMNRNSPRPDGFIPDYWTHTFDNDNNTFTAPGYMLYFDSEGTRDGDRRYEGRYSPVMDENNSNWNGIVEYTWDFGDASPLSKEAFPWHFYQSPGTYTVTLTVRDSYGTGDVSKQSFTVVVDHAPNVKNIDFSPEIIAGEETYLSANISDYEITNNVLVYRDANIEDGSLFDIDETLNPGLTVRWDINLDKDTNKNGILEDDWIIPKDDATNHRIEARWNESGTYKIIIEACDGIGVCVTLTEDIQVSPRPEPQPSLSDFELEDWSTWVKEAGSDLATYVALIAVALILGWLVLRESSEVEDEAKQAAESYTDVEHVEVQGGLLGMDQHTPPPAPAILSKEERRNEESGYVRPLRRRV